MNTVIEQEKLYLQAVETFGASFQRLTRAAEADSDRQYDLLQEIHVSIWKSLARFDGRCTLATWVYRVAHNATASYITRERRQLAKPMQLVEIDEVVDPQSLIKLVETDDALERLYDWIRCLKTIDRQVLTLYLEELDAKTIADITGMSPGAVATRISRLKSQLAKDFSEVNDD
ncbi:MAG: RNA polymerase sigma factor [Granulosicoccus sp.]